MSRLSLLTSDAGDANRVLSPVLSRAIERRREETAAADLGEQYFASTCSL